MTKTAEILAALPKLDAEDLAKVSKHLAALKAAAPKTTRKNDEVYHDVNNDWLLHGILRELDARGQGQLVPKGFAITKTSSFRGYAKHSENVRAWITRQVRRNLTKIEKLYLGDLAAGCLGDLIESWEHPVTMHMMLNNTSRIPEAIMRQFPGYVEAGLLSWILKGSKP